MGNITQTYNDKHISFLSASNTNISSLKCYFQPIQSGSGTTSPTNIRPISGHQGINITYCGNNLYDAAHSTVTRNYIRNDDGVVQSSSSSSYISTPINVKPLTSYTISMKSWHTNTRVYFLTANEEWISRDYARNGEVIVTNTPANCYKIQIQFYNTDDITDLQVIEGTKKKVYQSYDAHIFPITFPTLGKNLLDLSKAVIGDQAIIFGGEQSSSIADGSFELAAGTYTLSMNVTANAIGISNHQGSQVISPATNVSSVTFTLTVATKIRIIIYIVNKTAEEMAAYQYQLELGSSATTYEPYNNTIYGGYVDLITGQVYRTWRVFQIKDVEWTYKPANNRFQIQLAEADYSSASHDIQWTHFAICDSYATSTNTNGYSDKQIASYRETYLYIRDDNYTSTEDFIQDMGDAYIAYELKTPVLVTTLSANQLKTFVEYNNIWSDTNDKISITYDFHETSRIEQIKKQIIRNQPHIATVSSAIANFNTDMKAPIKSAKFYFNPIQEGSGDPSPSNIRTISGWDKIRVFQAQNIMPIVPNNWTSESKNDLTFTYSNNNTFTATGITNGMTTLFIPINAVTFDQNLTYNIVISFDPNPTLATDAQGNGNVMLGFMENNSIFFMSRTNFTASARYIVNTITSGSLDKNYQLNKLAIGLIQGCGDFTLHIQITPNLVNNLAMNWSSEGELYGGYVDLISGELYKEWHKANIAAYTWNKWGSQGLMYVNHTDIPRLAGTTVYCDAATIDGTGDPQKKAKDIIGYYGTHVSYPSYFFIQTSIDTSTTEGWQEARAYIAETFANVNVVFKLQTPQLITTLTPTQLTSLIGTNNIWSNANGNIEVKYWTH